MKTFLFALFFSIASFGQAPAAGIVSAKEHNDLVRSIRKQLHFNEKFKQKLGTASATVTFIVNDRGAVEVMEVVTDNPLLRDDIERQMQRMPIYKTPVLPNTLYTMKLVFKTQ